MRVKNIFILLLVVMVAFAFTACSKKQTAGQSAEIDTTPVTPPSPPPVEDETEAVTEPEVDTEPIPVMSDIFFDFDKSNLTSEAKRVLEENARQLQDARSKNIVIEGHCDERGTNSYNLALGEKRAKAAKDYLRSLGVAASRVKTVSMGEERPFDSGHTEAAWAKNRRAHFVIN
ncbi:MAG: peptidoglycan-associated lipoprotein Pal [Candidatus Krumholzibacteriia bacterium]